MYSSEKIIKNEKKIIVKEFSKRIIEAEEKSIITIAENIGLECCIPYCEYTTDNILDNENSIFHKSILLNCSHIICEQCILRIKNTNSYVNSHGIFDCPICRKQHIHYILISDIRLNIFVCPNYKCKETFSKLLNFYTHIKKNCLYRKIKCEYKCENIIKYSQYKKHIKKKHTCNKCYKEKILMIFGKVEHECPYDIIECEKKCGKKYERRKNNEHNIICTERIIICNNCDLEETYNYIKNHKQNCEIIKCPNCEIKFKKEKYDLHLDNCELFIYKCKFKNCTFESNLDKLQYHIISKHKYSKFIDTGIYKNKKDILFLREKEEINTKENKVKEKDKIRVVAKNLFNNKIDISIIKDLIHNNFIIKQIIDNDSTINKLNNGEFSFNDTQLLINIEKEYLTNI